MDKNPNDTYRVRQFKLAAYEFLMGAGVDLTDDNFKGTVQRFAKAMDSLLWEEDRIQTEVDQIMDIAFPTGYHGMIFCKNIRTYSFCPHHILPVTYDTHVGYIPKAEDGLVLGASKLARLVDILSKRMVLQEDLTREIADVLMEEARAEGVAVVMKGVHDCMRIRGVMQQNSTFDTSEMRGSFRDNPKTRDEFFLLIMTG